MGNFRVVAVIAGLVFSLLTAAKAIGAAPGPSDVVTEMVVKIKALRSAVPVVDYVHWETAYERLNEKERTARGFRTPFEMRDYYFRLLSDPESFTRQEVLSRIAGMPPEQRQQFDKVLEAALERVRETQAQMRERFRETQFDVGEAKIEGDTARVKLITMVDGRSMPGYIELVRRNDRWYLPSIAFATSE